MQGKCSNCGKETEICSHCWKCISCCECEKNLGRKFGGMIQDSFKVMKSKKASIK